MSFSHQDERADDAEKIVASLESQLAERDRQLTERDRQPAEIRASRAWRLASGLSAIRIKIFPKDSCRAKIAQLIYRVVLILRHAGIRALVQKVKARLMKPTNYQNWIADNEPTKKELDAQRDHSKESLYRPLISIITPVYNTPPKILIATIQSVIKQTYDNWELCLANGSPENRAIRIILDGYAAKDSRIKVVHLDENLGIAGNTNAAIKLSRGEFVAFLDHDDLLAPFALFSVVEAFASNHRVDLVYSDEDKITADGRKRYSPFFKPAFSPDLLRSVNYMPHFLAVRRSVGDEVGWVQVGFEGAQDYDLILRVAEKAREIAHCPKILYHWRAVAGSTALRTSEKDYATEAGLKALREHLSRTNIDGLVEPSFAPTTYHISYSFDNSTLVSIIIPSHDHADDLELCVRSILDKSTYKNFEILIVENNSREETTFSLYQRLKQYENIKVIEYHELPFNYSNINNFAVQHAQGSVLLFLNNDIEIITPDWLERMLEHVCRPEVGIVGAMLYYPDDTVQHGGVIIGIGGVAGHSHKHLPRDAPGYFGLLKLQKNLSAVTAACLMVKRDIFNQIEGFDSKFRLAFGDVDFCLKARSEGYLVVWTPYAELYHHESKTRGSEDTEEKIKRFDAEMDTFKQKWAAVLGRGDEYYNPNLTMYREDFSIAPKPHNTLNRIAPGLSGQKS